MDWRSRWSRRTSLESTRKEAAVRNNPLLKFLVIPFVLLALVLIVRSLGSPSDGGPQKDGAPSLTEDQAKKLGVDGDTASDTLRTMVAESKELKQQIRNA